MLSEPCEACVSRSTTRGAEAKARRERALDVVDVFQETLPPAISFLFVAGPELRFVTGIEPRQNAWKGRAALPSDFERCAGQCCTPSRRVRQRVHAGAHGNRACLSEAAAGPHALSGGP